MSFNDPGYWFRDSSLAGIAGTPLQILRADPERVAAVFCNLTPMQTAYLRLSASSAGPAAVRLADAGGPWTLSWREHGALVQAPWWGQFTGAGSISCIEILYRPPGPPGPALEG